MSTKKYCFQLGLFPELSLTEIASRLPKSAVFHRLCPEIAVAEIPADTKIPDIKTLGGIIRIAEYLEETERENISSALADILENTEEGQKIHFAVTTFPSSSKLNKKIILETKKFLSQKKRNARFINRNFQNPDAGTVHKERLIGSSGKYEFLIISAQNRVFLAQTKDAYRAEDFAIRDYEKPERDMKTGMLPPKLALMMINFSAENGVLPEKIWDPFCGTGTILGESLLLKIPCIGSDISPQLLKMSRKNLAALTEEIPSSSLFQLFQHDAGSALPYQIKKEKQCTIITEGYLGPIFRQPLSEKDLSRARKEVDPLMSAFFRESAKSGNIQKMIVCLPFWKTQAGKLEFPEKALSVAEKFWKCRYPLQTMLYRRENQIVGRKILILEKR